MCTSFDYANFTAAENNVFQTRNVKKSVSSLLHTSIYIILTRQKSQRVKALISHSFKNSNARLSSLSSL